jgi:Fe-S oxidoreductase
VRTGFWNRRLNRDSAQSLEYTSCGMCGACEESCPHGVAAADIVRCIRYYHDAEKEPDMARREFRDMGLADSLRRCVGCGMCEDACPQGVPVPDELQRAGRLLC